MANFIHIESMPDLATNTVTVPNTDTYLVQGTLSLPSQVPAPTPGAGGGAGTGSGSGPQVNSQVVVTIKQNGSTIYTSAAGDKGFCLPALSCTAGDVLSFQRSSSLSQDQQPNAVRLTLCISEGVA
jgi:hypothetical protein